MKRFNVTVIWENIDIKKDNKVLSRRDNFNWKERNMEMLKVDKLCLEFLWCKTIFLELKAKIILVEFLYHLESRIFSNYKGWIEKDRQECKIDIQASDFPKAKEGSAVEKVILPPSSNSYNSCFKCKQGYSRVQFNEVIVLFEYL